jgi:uncharacterized membrane protein YvlD (DUF360 family)
MPPKLKESDYFLSWIVMVLCYVVTTSMVGFAFGMVGLALGFNTRNQRPILNLITIPVLLLTTYLCFRFLVKELASRAVEKEMAAKRAAERAAKASAAANPALSNETPGSQNPSDPVKQS